MTNNITTTNYALTTLRAGTNPRANTANAALFQSMMQSHQSNSTFGIGSVGTKSIIVTPLQINASVPVSTSANISEIWCISDYYKVPAEDVRSASLEVRQEIADADFTDMSDIEIYDWIENKFKEKFGEDFMMACTLNMLDPNINNSWTTIGCNNYQSIGTAFYYTLNMQFGEKYRDNEYGITGNVFNLVNRERLYGDMSTDEIADVIRAKYPPNDKLTYRDVCLMLAEMHSVGIAHDMCFSPREVVSTYDANGSIINEPQGGELQKIWKEYLDKPFNIGIHNSMNNHNMLTGGYNDAHVLGQREFLIKYLGATVGPDGLLLPREWEPKGVGDTSFDFDITVPDLLSEFMKYLESHYRELAEKREGINSENRDNDLAELLSGEDSLAIESSPEISTLL